MEKQLKCVLVLSLKDMTLRKLAILLFTDSDIVASISKFQIPASYQTTESMKKWHGFIEDTIKNKVLKRLEVKFELPESLEKQVIDMVKPITFQIQRWKDCQEFYLSTEKEKISLPNSLKLFWTSTGMVDYKKTAQELVRCNALDVVIRYKLACVNCLEGDILLLWEKLPEEKKLYFYDKVPHGNPKSPMPFCWPHIVTGELSTLDCLLRRPDRHFSSFNQWAFECLAENGNKVAVEYFFQKLTSDEREASLTRTVKALLRNRFGAQSISYYLRFSLYENLSDISCYLLAAMTPAQRMEVFREHPGEVLLMFLDCPWPDLFLENVGLMWDFLPPSGYGELLRKMANRFAQSDHYFPKLFQEFFVQTPLDCKKCFIDQISTSESPASQFLMTFFHLEDSESIKVIFRNIDAAERMRLVLSEDVLRVFHVYLLDGGHMMEVCVREATQSEMDRNRLKKAFTEYNGGGIAGFEWVNVNRQFNSFLDEGDASGDKKNKAQKRKLENCCPQ